MGNLLETGFVMGQDVLRWGQEVWWGGNGRFLKSPKMFQQQGLSQLGQLGEKWIGLILNCQQAGRCPGQQMALYKLLLLGTKLVGDKWQIGFPGVCFLVGQKGQTGKFMPQVIGLTIYSVCFVAKLKIVLLNNGRFLTTHQPIVPQKEALVGKNIELKQLMMAGGSRVGIKRLG